MGGKKKKTQKKHKNNSPSVFLSDLLPSTLLFCYFPVLPFLLTTCSMPLHFIIPPHLISSCSSSSSLPLSILAHFIFPQGGSWCSQADEGCSRHCPTHICFPSIPGWCAPVPNLSDKPDKPKQGECASASLHSTQPAKEAEARQINVHTLLAYPAVPLEVTLALHNRPDST